MTLKKLYITIFILSLSFIYFGCSTSKEEKVKPKLALEKIPPGHAQINGTIIKIFPISEYKDSKGPCSKAPCLAMVKVTGTQYGAGFPVIPVNSEVKIKFRFTLNPTSKELFPNMEDKYPGLKVGDKFTAMVSYAITINSTIPNYEVFGYSIK